MSKSKSFIKGALILTVAGVFAKILGALYRIPFNRIVGEEGAALYALSYSLYLILFALSTAGIPLAVSQLVAAAEERKDTILTQRLFKVALIFMGGVGVVAFLGVFFGANWIASNLFHEPRAALSLKFLAPAMLFSCLTSVFRGYFQGKQLMLPTAISQVIEQTFRVLLIFVALFMLADNSLEEIVAGATFASVVGAILGFLFLSFVYLHHKRKMSNEAPRDIKNYSLVRSRDIIYQLLILTFPICIGALVLPLMQFIDTTLIIPRLIVSGYSENQALIHQGYLTSYAMPIISLPFIITTALSASLVPAISEANEKKDKHKLYLDAKLALALTMIIMLPAALGLTILGEPIIWLIFNHQTAGYALAYVGMAVLGVGIYQVSSGILQGLGKAYLPMVSLLLGLALKIFFTYFLTEISFLGVKGAAMATVIAYGISAFMNLYFLTREIGAEWIDFKLQCLKPLISATGMGVSVWLVYYVSLSYVGNSLATLIAILSGGSIYFVILFLIGGIKKEIIAKIPKVGSRLEKLIK